MSDESDIDELFAAAGAAYAAGNAERAAALFRKAHDIDPGNADVCTGLGQSYLDLGKFEDARGYLETALSVAPTDTRVLNMLGFAYGQTGRFAEAETCFRKLLRFGGGDEQTLSNLGSSLNELGRFDEAERMFRTTLRRNPESIQARYNLGLLHLLKGEFEPGWEGFELRREVMGYAAKSFPGADAWRGEPIAGRSIVLYDEQGLGDTIQFARYALLLKAEGAKKVTIRCGAALADILSTLDDGIDVVTDDAAAVGAEFSESLLSLPRLCGTTPDTVPSVSPYLFADDALPESADASLHADGERLRVGLVWAGNPKHKSDWKRSLKLSQLLPLLRIPDVAFYSFQAGPPADELADIPENIRPVPVFTVQRPLTEVAAAMTKLDLIVSVDTALAHLAGALGVPVWTLISYFPDWRWMLGRNDTPWYPTMRLFRQPEPGNWAAAIDGMTAALAGLKRR
ncbi:MAG: tetratricopeptide repeat protein [Rhodospirillales bacterium]